MMFFHYLRFKAYNKLREENGQVQLRKIKDEIGKINFLNIKSKQPLFLKWLFLYSHYYNYSCTLKVHTDFEGLCITFLLWTMTLPIELY